MKKLSENYLDEISGGKEEYENIKEGFCYCKKTCDDCEKVLYEYINSKNSIGLLDSAYIFHEHDSGIWDGEKRINLCRECYEKRFNK